MQDRLDQHWSNYYEQGKDFTLASSKSITKILGFVDPTLPKTCLDIGCGTGQLSREVYHRGYKVEGIDASSSAIRIAESLTTVSEDKLAYVHFDFERDDITLLPQAPYSLIICKLVYAFIKNKAAFLDRVSELLSPGGVFVIATPLLDNVPAEKKGIAVDYEVTMEFLKKTFRVTSYAEAGLTYFVCHKKPTNLQPLQSS